MNPEYTDRVLQTVSESALGTANATQLAMQAIYAAVIQGKFDVFGEFVTDDVEMNICGFEAMNGTWRGRSAVVEATRNNFALLSGQEPQVEAMISQGDSIAVLLRERGMLKSTGQAYNIRVVQWFTFVDGKVSRIDEIVARV